MSRIDLADSMMSIMMKMSDGNPGAASVLMQIMTKGKGIDPQSYGGSVSTLLGLDTNEIYGSRIWMLYKDVCKENINKTIAMLRAVQLGFISKHVLDVAIDNRGQGIDLDDLITKVKRELPEFVIGD